jgi:hypothetical protein
LIEKRWKVKSLNFRDKQAAYFLNSFDFWIALPSAQKRVLNHISFCSWAKKFATESDFIFSFGLITLILWSSNHLHGL